MFKSLFFRKKSSKKKFNFSPEAIEVAESQSPSSRNSPQKKAPPVDHRDEKVPRQSDIGQEPVIKTDNAPLARKAPWRGGARTPQEASGQAEATGCFSRFFGRTSRKSKPSPNTVNTAVIRAARKERKPLTMTIGPATIIVTLLAFLLVGGWAATATTAVVYGDPLSSRLIAQQSDMQFAYEQKLLVFRSQLDRIAQQARSDRTDVEGRITDLMLRQAAIETKQQLLLQMAGAAEPGPQKRSEGGAAPIQFAVLDKSTPPLDRLDLVEKAIEGDEQLHNRLADDFASLSNLRMTALRNELAALGVDINSFVPPRRPTGLAMPKSLTDSDSRFDAGLSLARRTYGDIGKLQQAANALPYARPVTSDFRQTSPFGYRVHPIFRYSRLHAGIDFAVPVGTPIFASGSGVVQSASVAGGYGNLVIIDHGNGITSRYAHLSSFLVQPGQPVAIGMAIARSGNTGASTGPHLHYETRVNGEPNDPMRFLAIGANRDGSAPKS